MIVTGVRIFFNHRCKLFIGIASTALERPLGGYPESRTLVVN